MTKYGFSLVREEQISEYDILARLYEHDKTGARLLSLITDDDNKVFNITFPTIPQDSTGAPHILEHSVLCGSEKYPVKEPFVELIKGSVNTYLNALTSPDHTSYPCASTNDKDFYNIIDVYIDAVFFPRLNEKIFKQEGWHYELEKPDDDLKYKGVVFNEMKGVFSSADSYVIRKSNRALLEGTGYGFHSGGDPEFIPDLDYDEFLKFYRKWYHPSNAYVFFYGNDDEDKRLSKMAEYLDRFEKKEIDIPDLTSVSWSGNHQQTWTYPATPGDQDKCFRFTGWLFPGKMNQQDAAGLALLEEVLLGTQAAPLRKKLHESGLGEDIVGNGFSVQYARMYFSLGLKGVKEQDLAAVDSLVSDTLADLAENGIDADAVEAALNSYEFKLRENNSGSMPRGLLHSMHMLPSWLHNDDPFSPLRFEKTLAAIRADKKYFEKLISRFFIDNNDRICFTAKPDPEFIRKMQEKENAVLKAVKQELGKDDLDKLIKETAELKKAQSEPDRSEDLARIPRLKLGDLDDKVKMFPCEPLSEQAYGAPGYYHDIFTNGIAYLDFCFDMHTVPQRLLSLFPLFCRSLVLMGSPEADYSTLIRRIGIHTGGIQLTRIVSQIKDSDDAAAMLAFRTKLTSGKMAELKKILAILFTGIHWDNRERFKQILLEEKAEYEAGIINSGHSIVLTRLRSAFSQADWLQEQFGGISYLHFLRETMDRLENDWEGLCADLKALYGLVINRQSLLVNLTCGREDTAQIQENIRSITELIPKRDLPKAEWNISRDSGDQLLTLPTQVNFAGTGMLLPEIGTDMAGALRVIRKYLGTDYLWNTVRVKGGAYGAFAAYDDLSRIFALVSYRDPHLSETFAVYRDIPDYLKNIALDKNELEKVKIGVIGDLDHPLHPDMQGYVSFRHRIMGVDDEYRQELRDAVFATSAKDFGSFGELLEEQFSGARRVALCSREKADGVKGGEDEFGIVKI